LFGCTHSILYQKKLYYHTFISNVNIADFQYTVQIFSSHALVRFASSVVECLFEVVEVKMCCLAWKWCLPTSDSRLNLELISLLNTPLHLKIGKRKNINQYQIKSDIQITFLPLTEDDVKDEDEQALGRVQDHEGYRHSEIVLIVILCKI